MDLSLETALLYTVAPVLPNLATQQQRYAYAVQGKWVTRTTGKVKHRQKSSIRSRSWG